MKHLYLKSIGYLIFLLSISFNSTGQIVKNYQEKTFLSETGKLPYRYFQPKQDIKCVKRLPLIIFLHGAGERGNDNKKQLIHVAEVFTDSANQEKFPAYVIAPQCAENYRWADIDWSNAPHKMPDTISDYAKMTMELANWFIHNLPVDSNRIYITGLSMGGFGTWDLISRFPDKFAAAAPVCGGGDTNQAKKLTHIPIWAFHGAKDKVVDVRSTRLMIEEIKKFGGTPKYTEYPELGHFSWETAYHEEQFLEWMFLQSK
ncbi:MAG: prolyl oligopeptidase family serine peptidase [Bacteroidota bacterium]|nr:prolyl oligopeptidase family serine peptidase [Bacteroidota bacterium]